MCGLLCLGNKKESEINSSFIASLKEFFQDERIGHILDRKVDLDELLELHEIINKPDEVYYDYTRQGSVGLAFIRFIDAENCIKVCIKLDKTKRKKDVNYISTIGKMSSSHLGNTKMYKKIE